jgi:hypothetical protein
MDRKGREKKRSWPNFKILSRHLCGGTREIHDSPQLQQVYGRDLKTGLLYAKEC